MEVGLVFWPMNDMDYLQNVPPYHIAAGNPARIIRRIQTTMDPEQRTGHTNQDVAGAEVPISELAERLESRK